MDVQPSGKAAFEKIKSRVLPRKSAFGYAPKEGDLVFFDNWRILHGRAAVGGRHLRFHSRMWIDRLLPRHHHLLGVRGLTPKELAIVQEGAKP